jgi:hypothetical protein
LASRSAGRPRPSRHPQVNAVSARRARVRTAEVRVNAGVMVVLATLAAVALWVVAAAVVEAVRRRRGRAQTLRAQLLLDEHARAWASRAAVAGASAHRLAD